ncbi:MAG: hypothetical protein AAGA75_00890 [Cyanobacteria bacterium P01_E01_bin.6]
MASRFLCAIAIATVTTVTTTSVTNYLLERPWCIHLDTGGHQTIEYGEYGCTRKTRMATQSSPFMSTPSDNG